MDKNKILITGAAGNIGTSVIKILREKKFPVRALVHRLDERSQALLDLGAEVVVADLMNGADMMRALDGCQRVYFGMSLSPTYLQATVIGTAAMKEMPNLDVVVNISQMTVSQMSLTNMTDSPQQQQHWMGEQVLNWSNLPVVHVRSTVFLEHPFFSVLAPASIAKEGTIRLPFGKARTSPIAVYDVARVVATILQNPVPHVRKVYELTGPASLDINEIAKQYEEALNRPVKYVDVPFDTWRDQDLSDLQLPPHVFHHLLVMTQLHADNRYDRLTDDVAKITGTPSMSIKDYIGNYPERFKLN